MASLSEELLRLQNIWITSIKEKGIEVISSKMNYRIWSPESVPPYISTGEWIIGGRRGGSCWDSEDNPRRFHSKDADPEPDFVQLDKLLELVWPAITHLQYKNLVRELVKEGERHEDEYYGNHTNYREKRVDLAALYSYMKERNVIT